jgi:hypothetical protein
MQPLRVALYARVSSGQQVTDATIAKPARRARRPPGPGWRPRRAGASLRRRRPQRQYPAAPRAGAPARRGRHRYGGPSSCPFARSPGPALCLPARPDGGVPAGRDRGRLPQPADRRVGGGRPAPAGAGHGRGIRAGQDPRAQAGGASAMPPSGARSARCPVRLAATATSASATVAGSPGTRSSRRRPGSSGWSSNGSATTA